MWVLVFGHLRSHITKNKSSNFHFMSKRISEGVFTGYIFKESQLCNYRSALSLISIKDGEFFQSSTKSQWKIDNSGCAAQSRDARIWLSVLLASPWSLSCQRSCTPSHRTSWTGTNPTGSARRKRRRRGTASTRRPLTKSWRPRRSLCSQPKLSSCQRRY